MQIFFFLLHSAVRNSFWINSSVFRDNPNSLLFPLHGLDDTLVSTYHIQGKLYTQQTFLFSAFFPPQHSLLPDILFLFLDNQYSFFSLHTPRFNLSHRNEVS